MEIDLAGRRDGIAERYVPELMRGELLEAEHVARYRWAAGLAAGRRVLDAGCGMGYGAAMLLTAGASEVVGVDLAEAVLDAARPTMPAGVVLEVGDLRTLDADDGSFGLVVCMEAIEHMEDPDAVLDELARVLAPDGFLAVSSPNRVTSDGRNPHHHHEYTADELERALALRFRHVRLVGQRTFTGSVVEGLDSPEQHAVVPYTQSLLEAGGNDSAAYLLAVAGKQESPPPLPSVISVGAEMEWNKWSNSWTHQQNALDYETRRANAAEARLQDRAQLQQRLVQAEQLLAEMPAQKRALADALAERDFAVSWARDRVSRLEEELRQAREPARLRVARAVRRRLSGS
jgi:SAM-dependent methyltransferase